MTAEDFDPLAQKAQADAVVEGAALRLRELLREAVGHLDPFPPFPDEPPDPVSMRKEELRRLDNLHPRDYLVYAYNALTRVVEIVLEQQEAKGS